MAKNTYSEDAPLLILPHSPEWTDDYFECEGYTPQLTAQRKINLEVTQPAIKDIWAFILYSGVTVSVIILIVVQKVESKPFEYTVLHFLAWFTSITATAYAGLIYFDWLRESAISIMKYTYNCWLILITGAVIVMLFKGWNFVYFLILYAISQICKWRWVLERIALSGEMLQFAASILMQISVVFSSGIVGSVACVLVWTIYWIGLHVSPQYIPEMAQKGIFLFWTAWSMILIRNLIHCTVAGVWGSHYLSTETQKTAKMSAKFALFCIGSVCLASLCRILLFVPHEIISFLRKFPQSKITLFLKYLLSFFNNFYQNKIACINKYGLVELMLFGTSYYSSAQKTWKQFKLSGLEDFAKENIVESIVFVASIIAAFNSMILFLIVSTFTNYNEPKMEMGLCCFCVAFFSFNALLTPIDSAVTAAYVCIAKDSQQFQQKQVKLWNLILARYPLE